MANELLKSCILFCTVFLYKLKFVTCTNLLKVFKIYSQILYLAHLKSF